jgi:hypothetical protein
VEIDPGGVGKGYAVDRMVEVLRARGIRNALVAASGSSISREASGLRHASGSPGVCSTAKTRPVPYAPGWSRALGGTGVQHAEIDVPSYEELNAKK